MKYKTLTFTLIAAITIVLGLASDYGTFAMAISDKYGTISQYENKKEFMSNCLLNDNGDGDTELFDPMGCSSESKSMQGLNSKYPTSDQSADENILLVNPLSDNDIYVDNVSHTFEEPDEVGWD